MKLFTSWYKILVISPTPTYMYVLSLCIFYTRTVGTESIQTPLNFSLFVILQPFAKII